MNELVQWIWLSLSCTVGSESFLKLYNKYSNISAIYELDEHALTDVLGSRSSDIESLSNKSIDKAREIYNYCTAKNIGLLVYNDVKYPEMLKKIKNPPVLLYYRGIVPDFDNSFCVSVVGTRRLSEYGLRNAFVISHDLARAGATVVSGMAIGVDGVSHAGALSAGGTTVAVLGSGIDVCYPSDHKMLAREIVKNGCVFTEYAPGTRPDKQNFPRRNRIISGLSAATLVIEGRERSGAILTARHASEQERVVYALPGNVGNSNSELTNLLIKNGAKLCTSADDIIRDFESSSNGILNPFSLSENNSLDIYAELKRFSVSAVTLNDRVFRSSRRNTPAIEAHTSNEAVNVTNTDNTVNSESVASEPQMDGFDADAIVIYKRIPYGSECTIESLVDSEYPLRKVMKCLLKLEMGNFVIILPGEKVKRNF